MKICLNTRFFCPIKKNAERLDTQRRNKEYSRYKSWLPDTCDTRCKGIERKLRSIPTTLRGIDFIYFTRREHHKEQLALCLQSMAGLIWAHASLWGFLINLPYQGIRWNCTSNCKQETPDNEFILLPVEKSISFPSILIFLYFWFFFLLPCAIN